MNEETEENSFVWLKAISFNKWVDHPYQCNLEEPGEIFRIKDLEKLFIEDLYPDWVSVTSHVSRYAGKQKMQIDGLVVKTQNNGTTVRFSKTIDDIYWECYPSPNSCMKALRRATEPIRKEFLKKENDFDGKFSKDFQIK